MTPRAWPIAALLALLLGLGACVQVQRERAPPAGPPDTELNRR